MPNRVLQWFDHKHLPIHLTDVSRACGELAAKMDADLVESAEKTAGLRKLLEANDCFVRAKIESQPKPTVPEHLDAKTYE